MTDLFGQEYKETKADSLAVQIQNFTNNKAIKSALFAFIEDLRTKGRPIQKNQFKKQLELLKSESTDDGKLYIINSTVEHGWGSFRYMLENSKKRNVEHQTRTLKKLKVY